MIQFRRKEFQIIRIIDSSMEKNKIDFKYSSTFYRRVKKFVSDEENLKFARNCIEQTSKAQSENKQSNKQSSIEQKSSNGLLEKYINLEKIVQSERVINIQSVASNKPANNIQQKSNLTSFTYSQMFEASNQMKETRLRDPLARSLRNWAISNRITHSAVTNLLSILDEHAQINSLPKDSRTLLRTPTSVDIQQMR